MNDEDKEKQNYPWNNGGQALGMGLPVIYATKEEIERILMDPFGRNKKEGDTAPYYPDPYKKENNEQR